MVMPARVADAHRVAMCCAVRVQLGCSRACESHRNEAALRISGPCFSPRDEEENGSSSRAALFGLSPKCISRHRPRTVAPGD